jgi:nitrite reductase/ring-hydroxylating ferredoxin subunit
MTTEQRLCALAELPDGDSRGLLRRGNDDQVFAVRRGQQVYVYRNDCPHDHRPMELRQDKFLSADRQHIVCYAHGAHFEIESGLCFAGPCDGERLARVPSRVDDGVVWIESQPGD